MPNKVIALLEDGKTHSGVELGRALNITRSAVGKQITKLKEMGFQIESVKGAGYRVAVPFERLDAASISAYFADEPSDFAPTVEVLWSTHSTNDYVSSAIKNGEIKNSGFICVAEHQTVGRGRRGKSWISPLGGGLYLSMAWRFEQGAESLEGFSLSVAMAIVEVLERDFGVKDLKIKWPNDIFLDGKKAGGILIDVMGEAGGLCWVVIGIGLNINPVESSMCTVDQPWADISVGDKNAVSRNKLTARIASSVAKKAIAHEKEGFGVSEKDWKKYDAFLGKNVVVKVGDSEFYPGVSLGISKTGGLIVESNGVRRILKSGEVSLRYA